MWTSPCSRRLESHRQMSISVPIITSIVCHLICQPPFPCATCRSPLSLRPLIRACHAFLFSDTKLKRIICMVVRQAWNGWRILPQGRTVPVTASLSLITSSSIVIWIYTGLYEGESLLWKSNGWRSSHAECSWLNQGLLETISRDPPRMLTIGSREACYNWSALERCSWISSRAFLWARCRTCLFEISDVSCLCDTATQYLLHVLARGCTIQWVHHVIPSQHSNMAFWFKSLEMSRRNPGQREQPRIELNKRLSFVAP